MELRQNKPIHLRCPKCGHDFSFNGNKIVQERQAVSQEISILKAKITEIKQRPGFKKTWPEYKRVCAKLDDAIARITAINAAYRNMSEHSEIEKYKIFYTKVKKILGEQKTVELIREAEDELIYRDYDMAIQKHNNFNGV